MTTLAALYSAMGTLKQFFGGGNETVVWEGIAQLKSDLGQVANALSEATNSDTNLGTDVNRYVRELAYDIEDWADRFVFRYEESESKFKSKRRNLWRFFYRCYDKSCVEAFSRRARALLDCIVSSSNRNWDETDRHHIHELTEPLLGGGGSGLSNATWGCKTDRQILSGSSSYIEMKTLTPKQSWQLFLMKSGLQLSDNPDVSNPWIEDIREKIVRSCQGLPLALTVLADNLSATSLQNWELKLRDLHSMNENANHVMDLSYLHLESWLKPCFLYMGLFPPHQPILVEKMQLLWMAEGFISKGMESGEECFSELVNRNLVFLDRKEDLINSTRFVSGCLHDLIRELCIFRGEKDDFFKVIDSSHASKISSSTCRVSVYLNKCEDIDKVIPRANRIRSILFFDTVGPIIAKPRKRVEPMAKPRKVADLTKCQRVRVLGFDGVNFQAKKLPKGIEKLIHLRHLSFQGCYLLDLPSSFGNFPFLEILDLRVIDSCVMTIPNVLRKMSRLRHLYFPLAFRCATEDKLKLDGLKNLEVLENFHPDSCDAGDLLMLENLEILKVTTPLMMSSLELKTIIKVIKNMKSICHTSLHVEVLKRWARERLPMVAELLGCSLLHALELKGDLVAFPRDITFGSNFRKLVFDGSMIYDDLMPTLGKLPSLRSLVLCNDAVVGKSMVCYESDFPQLTSLKLANLRYLRKWDVGSGAMPNLAILTVERCGKLSMLPSEFANIPTLRGLKVGSMSDKFMLAVKKMKYGNNQESSITFYEC